MVLFDWLIIMIGPHDITFKLISHSELFNISCLWVRNWDEEIISMNAVDVDRGSQMG